MSDIFQRKRDHIELAARGPVVGADHGGLFDEVTLVHQALPELAMGQIDLSARLLDSPLRAPLMVTGMTGGPPETQALNAGLARLCQDLGVAFGVGSQRIITKDAATAASFQVRQAAPDVVLLGNIGVMQARAMGPAGVAELMKVIGADYMAVHLNPAQELAQKGVDADRDFRGGVDAIARLVDALDGRVLVKECGTGLSTQAVARLHAVGVRAVDVSGSGGTSWVKVEALRADGPLRDLGMLFQGWGIPTAAAVVGAAGLGPQVVASGGIDDPLKAAKALALGADVAGCARPVLQAWLADGEAGARRYLETMIHGLRMALALTGSPSVAALRRAPRVVGPRLRAWIDQASSPLNTDPSSHE
ncbi:MAG: type 2 isopentenyl-diphosphate Delta-isomerase [Myxococcales bacterium]|nr:type 2 isopentenyl-diphosphate Delta-isomerase [Myxococcales bacterium]